MPKIAVIYYSKTGNTKKMAEFIAVAAEAAGAEVSLIPADEATPDHMHAADGIIIGSPTYYGHSAGPIRTLFDQSVKYHGKLAGKVGGAFTSSHNLAGGNETTMMDILESMLVHGMIIQGNYDGDHYGPVAIGSPDRRAEIQCRQLSERVVKLLNKIGTKS
ncbi:MAG: NAD(P)H-dependent oxidoreductase [Lentisphaeria bacterium]